MSDDAGVITKLLMVFWHGWQTWEAAAKAATSSLPCGTSSVQQEMLKARRQRLWGAKVYAVICLSVCSTLAWWKCFRKRRGWMKSVDYKHNMFTQSIRAHRWKCSRMLQKALFERPVQTRMVQCSMRAAIASLAFFSFSRCIPVYIGM